MDSRYIVILIMLICFILIAFFIAWMVKTDRYQSVLKQRAMEMEERNRELNTYKEKLKELESRYNDSLKTQAEKRQLLRGCEDAKDEVISGRPVLDTLLNHKMRQCQQEGLKCSLNIGDLPEEETLNDASLVSLIGNLLDNAMEAAIRYRMAKKNGQKPGAEIFDQAYVALDCHNIKGQWFLAVENSKKEDERPISTGMRTTKIDTSVEHGLGTRIINRIIKECKGTIERKDDGDRFRVSLMIPMTK